MREDAEPAVAVMERVMVRLVARAESAVAVMVRVMVRVMTYKNTKPGTDQASTDGLRCHFARDVTKVVFQRQVGVHVCFGSAACKPADVFADV